MFQVSDYKRNHFLKLLDNNYLSRKPTYTKDGSWFKLLSYFDLLYARATRAITNHILIEKYHLRFFPKEKFNYLYRIYPIESRCYILHECKRYNNYWNPSRESFSYFFVFLEYNPEVFSFYEEIT